MKKLLLTISIALFAATATAQVSNLPNSGCKNAAPTLYQGAPKINTSMTFLSAQFPCNSPGTTAFVVYSLSCQVTPPLGWGCIAVNNPCALLVPDIITSSPIRHTSTLPIPNDLSLVGFTFCAQGGCLSSFGTSCFSSMSQALSIKVQM